MFFCDSTSVLDQKNICSKVFICESISVLNHLNTRCKQCIETLERQNGTSPNHVKWLDLSKLWRMEDALACTGDEGRDKLR